jgi:hypothetical protein
VLTLDYPSPKDLGVKYGWATLSREGKWELLEYQS